jgi:hypothetical protein
MGLGASPALAIKCDAPRIAERGGLGRLTQVSVVFLFSLGAKLKKKKSYA